MTRLCIVRWYYHNLAVSNCFVPIRNSLTNESHNRKETLKD